MILQRIFQQEWHRTCKVVGVFLGVRESRNGLALDHIRSVRELHVDESGWTMTNGGHNLARLVELSDQRMGDAVICEVEHGCNKIISYSES